MRRMTVCTLISFQPDAHEVGTDPVIKRRRVKCQELGLSQMETYQAGGEGLRLQAKLLIPYDKDYNGERDLEYNGERWKVINDDPYKEWNGVVLLIARIAGNAGDVTPAPAATTTGQEVG